MPFTLFTVMVASPKLRRKPAVKSAMLPARELLRDLFQAGLDAVQGRRCVAGYLSQHPPQRSKSLRKRNGFPQIWEAV